MAVIDFLKTERPKAELAVALAVIREFKDCESLKEWGDVPFRAWVKLEQLEEFLAHLTEGAALREDTRGELIRQGRIPA